MVVQHSGCWEASWVLGKWLGLGLRLEPGLGLVVDLRLLALSSQETVATAAVAVAAAAAVAGKCSWLEGSSAGPEGRNCNVHEL